MFDVSAEPATRSDIVELRAELKGDFAELRTELKGDIAELGTEFKGDIAELRTELRGDIDGLKREMQGMERRMLLEIGHALNVAVEQIGSKVSVVDEKYQELPRR